MNSMCKSGGSSVWTFLILEVHVCILVFYVQFEWCWNIWWTTLLCLCRLWPFVNINSCLIGVVKVTLSLYSIAISCTPQARIIYDFKEAAWGWHKVANDAVIQFIWTRARTKFLFRRCISSSSQHLRLDANWKLFSNQLGINVAAWDQL